MRLPLLVLLVFAAAASAQDRPNILVVYADDQRFDEVELMPHLQRLVVDAGASLERFYATTPACCPARATLLRGQYAHSHGIKTSRGEFQGGWDEWRRLGLGASTLATWMDDAGYATGFYGKYINGYPNEEDVLYVPPGWDDWFGGWMRFSPGAFYDWRATYNGEPQRFFFGPENYRTDVEGQYVVDFIDRALGRDEPFFVVYAPISPHAIGAENNLALPPIPAPRHEGLFSGLVGLRRPSYDEADVSDKINFIRRFPRLSPEEIERIDVYRRLRAESMLAVDDVLRDAIELLEARGELDNTYIVYSSDNGFHLGEHRLPPERKGLPYEESVRMPMYIRGPGIEPGARIDALTSNVDLAQTIAEWGGAEVPDFVEGRSFAPLLRPGGADAPFRTAVLNEQWITTEGVPEYFQTIITPRYKLTRWSPLNDAIELYDLVDDPGELRNIVEDDEGDLTASLTAVLDALETCTAADCRIADRLWQGDDTQTDSAGAPARGDLSVSEPYPNPARELVSVRLEAGRESAVTLRLIDARGREVARSLALVGLGGRTAELPVRDLAAGVYLLDVQADGGDAVTRRVVVQR